MKFLPLGPGGARLRYLEFVGDGPSLVMVHGLGCASSFEYRHVAQAPALAARHVLLVDLFGSGYSDHPRGFGYRIADHAEVLAGFIETVVSGPADLYGHSMGGTIAIEAAGQLGARLRSLVLSEANLDPGGGQFSRDLADGSEADYVAHRHAEAVAAARASGNADWAATMRLSAPEAIYRGAKSLVDGVDPSWRELLYRLPLRKSFLFGERSLPDPDAETLPRHGIPVLTIPNAGHSIGLETPPGLATVLAAATGG